jgi:hypothetical protein
MECSNYFSIIFLKGRKHMLAMRGGSSRLISIVLEKKVGV